MLGNYLFTLTIWLAINLVASAKLEKISLQSYTTLDDFSGYNSISIVHFFIPKNVITALFKFTAKEVKTGGLGLCSPRDVTIYLKYGSIPLGSPDGSRIEAKLFEARRQFYNLTFTSEDESFELQKANPTPGDWYAIAFRSWTDPDSEKITQQGLGATCQTILDSELSIEKSKIASLIDINVEHTVLLNETIDSASLQFLIPNIRELVNISISSSCENLCRIAANVVVDELSIGAVTNSSEETLSFIPYPEHFHYLNLRLLSGNSTNITISILPLIEQVNDQTEIQLVRKTLPEFFSFDYEYFQGNSTKPVPVNISNSELTVLSFRVGGVYDIGGTLSIGIRLLNESRNTVVVGCISLGIYPTITKGGSCKLISTTTIPDFWINSTTAQMLHIPYPEPGIWHLTLKAFKFPSNCSCVTICQTSPCENCNCMEETATRIETSVGSSPCVEGKCNSNGRCNTYLHSGGFAFSACHCTGGYRGFDCADDTYVLTGGKILVRLLMLTLSNLAFIASIYIAYKREYYTEAVVYGAVMFFSTFYHACEAGEDVMSVCITRLSVLQFCDFYNALLSIWVTLVAMASFGPKLTGFCQVTGAIILALGAELDRTALWVFLLPALTGSMLIGISWGFRCRRQRNFSYPASRYRHVYLPTGLGVVLLGLVCYAFLQTRRNYHIVHSFWHICVAIGAALLLPKRKHMK